MFFPGTGPRAVRNRIRSEWQAARAGRPDLPDVVRDASGDPSSDPDDASAPGKVLVVNDRSVVSQQRAVYDLIHCYHPEQSMMDVQDAGFKEQNSVENVQIDIECADRPDPETGERLSAKDRMVGTREEQLETYGFTLGGDDGTTLGGDTGGTLGTDDAVAYPGLLGETLYILETVRRGFEEWDKVSYTPMGATLENSQVKVSLNVELEQLARNTVV